MKKNSKKIDVVRDSNVLENTEEFKEEYFLRKN